jgi:iron complex outermembrane receptor protein
MFQIPVGDLSAAISTYVRQSGVQIVYRADELKGIRSTRISGHMTAKEALSRLLAGSGFEARHDSSGAFAVIRTGSSQAPKTTAISYASKSVQSAPAPASAPTPAPSEIMAPEAIIVTARRREEALLDVPVAITAVSAQDLERRGVNSLDGVARLVPQLLVGEGGTNTGGNIVLRGIGGADSPLADQGVSFNIDGVQVGRASVRRMGQMDLQQVEVLKGPQALFFGKNSPGGIISIRSADPTRDTQGKVSVGYEVNAHEWRGEGFIAGPISDDLGFRLAAYGSKMRGWVENVTPRTEVAAPKHRFAPRSEEFAIRGTLKFEPSDQFNARLKVNYGEVRNDGFSSNLQLVACPNGTPQSGQIDDCRGDDKVSVGALGPNFGRRAPGFGRGDLRGDQKQTLIGLEMNYKPSETLTVTSLTGYYGSTEDNLANVTATYVPGRIFAVDTRLKFSELSQELRLTSDFDGPLNFMTGVHLQHATAQVGTTALLNGTDFTTMAPLVPTPISNAEVEQKGKAYSGFLQMQWAITDQIELSAGGRYSYEKKRLSRILGQLATDPATGVLLPLAPIFSPVTSAKWNDFSPEVTLSYRPDRNLNIYGSYKHGFISGGFNGSGATGAANTGPLDYDQQIVKGFEAGAKASLFGGTLNANLALYTYEAKGLQVTIFTGQIQELKNIGKVRTKGGELDLSYRTPIDGLTLTGAIAYNRARYVDYFSVCYRGQSKDRGCRFAPVPGQPGVGVPAAPGVNGSLQDLSGTQVVRAPEWSGNVGFEYTTPISDGLKLGLSTNFSFSSSFLSNPTSQPFSRVPSYGLLDATLRLAEIDNRWELAVIGRNLTEKYYWLRSTDTPFSGTVAGNETGAALYADQQSPVSRGREILLRVSSKF